MMTSPAAFHISKAPGPRILALLLCIVLVFSPWIFIPAGAGLWSGDVYAAPVNITGGNITTRQDAGNDTITIQGNATINISGNNITGRGGGLYTNASLTVKDSSLIFANNNVTDFGGSIYSSGPVVFENTEATFMENEAREVSAIYSGSSILINNSTMLFSRNNGNVGTIYTPTSLQILGSNISFQNNKANTGSAAITATNVLIDRSTVLFNGSISTNFGGNIENSGPLTISNSNVSFFNSVAGGCSSFHTGGLVSFLNSTVDVQNNNVTGWGGGFHAVNNMRVVNTTLTLSNNKAGTQGGGIYVGGSDVANFTNSHVVFTNNRGNSGGGLNTAGGVNIIGNTTTFINNTAVSSGGGIYANGVVTLMGTEVTLQGNNATSLGGGIFASGTIKMNTSTIAFDDNTAATGGGFHVQSGGVQITNSTLAMNNNSATNAGGGFNVAAGSAIFNDSAVTFTNNKAISSSGTGGGFAIGGGSVVFDNTTATFANNNAYKGGGFHTDGNLNLISATLTFNNNNATIGGGFNVGRGSATFTDTNATFTANTATDIGGGFNVDSGNATFTNAIATFTKNEAAKGGGFSVGVGGSVTVSGTGMVTFTENNATQGGGLWSGGNVLLAAATRVFNNTATEGGGIYAANSSVSFSGAASIAGNSATSGGGIYADGTVSLSGAGTAAVSGNNATEGGGIYADGTVSIAGANAQFTSNTATRGGGIFTAAGSGVHMVGNATFADNSATESGGGLHASGNATITGGAGGFVAFSNNNAAKGGGIYAKDSVNISGTGGEFRGNVATEGGGIWAENSVDLAPGTGQVLTFATPTDNIYLNNATAKLTIGGEGVTVFRSTNNHVPGGVDILKGRTELRGPVVFENTSLHVADSTLYMGDNTYGGVQNRSTRLTVSPRRLALSGNSIGSGATTPYAKELTSFHLDNNAILALEMNHPGDAAAPYFTLKNGKATTGTNTALHGVIGTNLDQGVDFTHTYVIFSGSTGTIDDFTPADYTTSHALVALANPIYDAATGTFAIQVVRGTVQPLPPPTPPTPTPDPTPDPDPTPPDPTPPTPVPPDPTPPTPTPPTPVPPDPTPPTPVPPTPPTPVPPTPVPPTPVPPTPVPPTPEPPVPPSRPSPEKPIYAEIRDMLQNDYVYNGENQQETLIGKNPLLDSIYYVKPNGEALLNDKERLKALASAVHMGVYISAREIMFEAHSQLRSMLFPFRDVPRTGSMTASVNFAPDTTVRWADAARAAATEDATPLRENRGTLWAQPFYSYETLRGGTLTDGLRADYDLNLYGGALGGDITFGNGEYVLGGVFAAGHGRMETTGKDLTAMTNSADFAGGLLSLRWLPVPALELGIYAGLLHQRNAVEQANVLQVKSNFDSLLYQAGANLRYQMDAGHDGARVFSVDTGADVLHFRQDAATAVAMNRDIGQLDELETTTVLLPITFGLRDKFTLDDGSELSLNASLGYRLALGDRRVKGRWRVAGGIHPVTAQGLEMDTHTATAGIGLQWEKGDFALRLNYEMEMGRRQRNHMLAGSLLWEF